MKYNAKYKSIILIVFIVLFTNIVHAQTDTTQVSVREKLPLDMGIELLGKSYVYSVCSKTI